MSSFTESTSHDPLALSQRSERLTEAMNLGQVFAKSGYFQDAREAAQAVVKILAGQEIGLPPMASMTNIYIVKGKVSLGAAIMGALIKGSGKYDYRIVVHSATQCELAFFESGREVGRSVFTMEDAKTAKLDGSDNWKNYPRNMLFSRAMSNGARWFCAEIFRGPVYTPEEIEGGEDVAQGQPATLAPVIVTGPPEPEAPGQAPDALISEPQKKRFWAIAREHGWTEADVRLLLDQRRIAHTAEIPAGKYDALIDALKAGPIPPPEAA